MFIYFRVDANDKIGNGHLMRCLSLAYQAIKEGHSVSFIMKNPNQLSIDSLPKNANLIQIESIDSTSFLENIDSGKDNLIIVDHYELHREWHQKIKAKKLKLLVIDDMADSDLECDFILNQNINSNLEMYKTKNSNSDCSYFLGPEYALLREEFLHQANQLNSEKFGLFISMGGADGKNQTPRIIRALKDVNYSERILIIIGPNAQNENEIKNELKESNLNYEVKINSKEIALDISQSKLCIGAGGISNYERIFLSTPTLVLATADNQIPSTLTLEERGVIAYAGKWDEISDTSLKEQVSKFLENSILHKEIVKKSKSVVDGKGAQRVIEKLSQH